MSPGFSLVESLIALALTMTVTGTALTLVTPASRAAMTQPEVMDVQQRARVAAEMIARDVSVAGVGDLPAVLPRRLGAVSGDGPDVARDSAITLFSIPAAAPETTIAQEVSAASLVLLVNPSPSCGARVACGLAVGQDVLIATDDDGRFDVFRITQLAGGAATLRHHGQDLAAVYPVGSVVRPVVSRTFEFVGAARQLRQYDGDLSDQPAVDHLSSVSFSYWGVPAVGGGGLEAIPLASLVDGPWMGGGTTRMDADLVRVRGVTVAGWGGAAPAAFRWREVRGECFGKKPQRKGVDFACGIRGPGPDGVFGDPERIRQVLVNLVNNAVKFTHQGDVCIELSAEPAADGRSTVAFAVHDAGIGVPVDRRDRLFPPFTQGDASTTRK